VAFSDSRKRGRAHRQNSEKYFAAECTRRDQPGQLGKVFQKLGEVLSRFDGRTLGFDATHRCSEPIASTLDFVSIFARSANIGPTAVPLAGVWGGVLRQTPVFG
jgi:hypothetical protein